MKELQMNKLYTIGFTGKNAAKFFSLLKHSGADHLIDVRLNNVSQLAGFAKRDDLKFFLKEILGWSYSHCPELAPTKEILDEYKKNKGSWENYEISFFRLLEKRAVEESFSVEQLSNSVLLCSEDRPENCHRRLVAEYLNEKWGNVFRIHHLY